ncbi:hypothetical protein LAZ67_20001341 [Cordylochernes scorpioides]|uniref:RNA-directed DNA polymerase n=1 Tax=Cordylochernes scorpioides TaxID=51811 RepID=A0ABY6LK59_9ARAC|nr:hypothetical protein LAZ67_20001341 [Cordylochernes scorpioides]
MYLKGTASSLQLLQCYLRKSIFRTNFQLKCWKLLNNVNSPTGGNYAIFATSHNFATKMPSIGAVNVHTNWENLPEHEDPEIGDGYTVVQSKKSRRDSGASGVTAAYSNIARNTTRRQRSSVAWIPRVQEVKVTRAHIAEARAQQASSTQEQCVFIEHYPDLAPYHYLKAIDRVVGGARYIIQLTRMNGHVLVGLASKNLTERVIEKGLEIEGSIHMTFPFRKRSEKITIGNLPFYVEDAVVIDALSPYGRVTSIAPKQLKAGEYGYTDGRREAYILLHDGMKLERLPTRLDIKTKGDSWPAFLTFGIRCSKCHNQGHRRANCPMLARQSTGPWQASPPSHTDVTSPTAPQLPRQLAPAPPAPAPPTPSMEVSNICSAARAPPHRPAAPRPPASAPPASSVEVPPPASAPPDPSLEVPSDGPTAQISPTVNAYKEFIPDHARLRTPLINLLKKDIMWVWDDECQKAFTNLKENLTTHPTLHLYQEGLPCQVYCNTSTFSITGVLKQVYPDGKTYTVQHFSRSLRSHERNYSDLELQCLAIVESVDNFRTCLMDRKFTIFSDHPALQWLKEIKAPSGRLFRWRLRLSRYEYEVRSINGVQQYETGIGTRIPFCGFLDAPLIQSQQSSPPGKSRVTIDHNKLRTVSRKGVLKTIVPSSLTTRLLKSVHTQHHHPNISKMTRLISAQYYWQNMTQDIAKQVKTCPTCRFARRIDEYKQPARKNTDTAENPTRHGNRAAMWPKPCDKFSTFDLTTKQCSRRQAAIKFGEVTSFYKSNMERLPRQQENNQRTRLLIELSSKL